MVYRQALIVSALLSFSSTLLFPLQSVAQSNSPSSFQATLSRGDDIYDNRYLDGYQVQGTAGDRLSIRMNSSDFDSYLVLADSQGRVIAINDNAVAGNGNAQIVHTLPYTGMYRIIATTRAPGVSGRYWMALNEVPTEAEEQAILGATRALFELFTLPVESGTSVDPNNSHCINGVIVMNGQRHSC